MERKEIMELMSIAQYFDRHNNTAFEHWAKDRLNKIVKRYEKQRDTTRVRRLHKD